MTSKFGFTSMTIAEFEKWLPTVQVARTILHLQEHHTLIPNYTTAKGKNNFDVQLGMKNYHVYNNGWADIGQHFTIFPDGQIMTGRSLERVPACIKGRNENAICIENMGDFDKGKDAMTAAQRDTIIRASAAIVRRFAIPLNTDYVVYHHWFDLNTGARTNGNSGSVKSCPGTNFFGGNKVEDAQRFFLPLVNDALNGVLGNPMAGVIKFGYVTSTTLNIRKGPGTNFTKVNTTYQGAILRIYEIRDGWYRIARFQDEWVSGNFVSFVNRAIVNADRLNIRSGPGTSFPALGAYARGQEVFVFAESGTWAKVGPDERWVSSNFLTNWS
jgi:uncharacterized protein YraI